MDVKSVIEGLDEKTRAEVEELAAQRNMKLEELVAEKLASLPDAASVGELNQGDKGPVFEITWT